MILPLTPETLWSRILEQTQHGLACGALQSIPTTGQWLEDEGLPFWVHQVTNLVRKDEARQRQMAAQPEMQGQDQGKTQGEAQEKTQRRGKDFNPFLPYEPDLYVGHLSGSHVCLLNKFNVVPHHALVVTSAFEEQDSLLTVADFEALLVMLRTLGGLVFYNGGKGAGASQRHKHLQWVPVPFGDPQSGDLKAGEPKAGDPKAGDSRLGEEGAGIGPEAQAAVPLSGAILRSLARPVTQMQPFVSSALVTSPALPFRHRISLLSLADRGAEPGAAAELQGRYWELLGELGLRSGEALTPGAAYNLLVTPEWLLVVPRHLEDWEGISVNSLAFAGALLVRNEAQLEQLRILGPLNLLKAVTFAG